MSILTHIHNHTVTAQNNPSSRLIMSFVHAANFDVTSDKEITLAGFLALHEMTACDEDGEEELWQVMKALGYNKQLQLSQVSQRHCMVVGSYIINLDSFRSINQICNPLGHK